MRWPCVGRPTEGSSSSPGCGQEVRLYASALWESTGFGRTDRMLLMTSGFLKRDEQEAFRCGSQHEDKACDWSTCSVTS